MALREVDTRDKLLIAAIIMQAVTLYFAWAALDQAEHARYAAYDALENSRDASQSCSSAAYSLHAVKDAADEAASTCRGR
ncbi:hypothetical protein SMRU11_23970 [Sinorhizobium meliloti RU11/001]|nr:hypothetical protein SMRU11_23970 [Sinorhizobium meliloti RU11/001]